MYIEFLKKSFQSQFIYRANTLIRIFTSFIFVFIMANVWTALYSTTDGIVDGINLSEMLTYVLMVEVVRTVVLLPVSRYVAGRAKTGIVSIDFIRPINLKLCAIFNGLGENMLSIVFFVAPIVVIGSLIWGFVFPSRPFQMIFFIIALFMAVILYSTMEYIMGLTAFWTKTDFHINWIVNSFMTMFAGMTVPLWFYPKPIKLVADVLPFKYFIFEPINIFLGKVDFSGAINIIIMQFVWLGILLLIERFVWHFAQRVVTIQGG
ncbi:MAG: ABC-2 family transporter protein [Firmicutes bacterium]|nr:ABC-2 family transporter protein [Bacillota bacterium]